MQLVVRIESIWSEGLTAPYIRVPRPGLYGENLPFAYIFLPLFSVWRGLCVYCLVLRLFILMVLRLFSFIFIHETTPMG